MPVSQVKLLLLIRAMAELIREQVDLDIQKKQPHWLWG